MSFTKSILLSLLSSLYLVTISNGQNFVSCEIFALPSEGYFTVTQTEFIFIEVSGSDRDETTISIDVLNANETVPEGASISPTGPGQFNPSFVVFQWTPSVALMQLGFYNISILFTDESTPSDTITCDINILVLPIEPTSIPTTVPTMLPTQIPTNIPTTNAPTTQPSHTPTIIPSLVPSGVPTIIPTNIPTTPSNAPTVQPSHLPTEPSITPTVLPSGIPTVQPSNTPTVPSSVPTLFPTVLPTIPTIGPSNVPSDEPSSMPSDLPTVQPSLQPSHTPTQPSIGPSNLPTQLPSTTPTRIPTIANPIYLPTMIPSSEPSGLPTGQPSNNPTIQSIAGASTTTETLQTTMQTTMMIMDVNVSEMMDDNGTIYPFSTTNDDGNGRDSIFGGIIDDLETESLIVLFVVIGVLSIVYIVGSVLYCKYCIYNKKDSTNSSSNSGKSGRGSSRTSRGSKNALENTTQMAIVRNTSNTGSARYGNSPVYVNERNPNLETSQGHARGRTSTGGGSMGSNLSANRGMLVNYGSNGSNGVPVGGVNGGSSGDIVVPALDNAAITAAFSDGMVGSTRSLNSNNNNNNSGNNYDIL